MKSIFLETRNVSAFRSAMTVLEDVDRGQPGLGVVWGRAGRGKTLCAREYAVRTGAIYLRVMEDWTARAMLAALCREINGSEPRSVDRCKTTVCEALDGAPRTILVDEADRLPVGLVEHFRDIHDSTGVPVALIGEEHLFAALNARRRLWSRVTRTVEFGAITAEDIMLFGMRAAGLQVAPDSAQALQKRAGGDFRLVWQDMHELEQMARASGTQKIERGMIDALQPRKTGPKPDLRTTGGRHGARG